MRDWKTSPRYQRALQRLMRMSPEQKAIFTSANLDEVFADEEMKGRLNSMRMAANKEAQAKSLELGERGLGLQEKEFRFAKRQIPIATAIGLGEVGASTYMGLQRIRADTELAERLKLRQGLYRRY